MPPSPHESDAVAFPMRLEPPSGEPIVVHGPATLGRSHEASIRLKDASISRRHASVEPSTSGDWFVTDLGSRHGTFLDGERLAPNAPASLRGVRRLKLGGVTLKVRILDSTGGAETPVAAEGHSDQRQSDRSSHVSTVRTVGTEALSSVRLRQLVQLTSGLFGARSIREIGERVGAAVREGLGVEWAGLVKPTEDGVQTAGPATAGEPPISRTLIEAAREPGQVMRLDDEPSLRQAHSVLDERIESAFCARVRSSAQARSSEIRLYATDRRERPDWDGEAPEFFAAAGELASLAIANIQRRRLALRKRELAAEVEAAASVQRRMLPEPEGRCGPVEYAYRLWPGRGVAGDLFAVGERADGSAWFCLGDVSGKGVGPSLLMAAVVAQLNASLGRGEPVKAVIAEVSRFVFSHSGEPEFVTAIAGAIDPAGTLEVVDAGHGYGLLKRGADGTVEPLDRRGGLPLGISAEASYESWRSSLHPGDTLLLCSDGVAEQRSPDGVEFGRTAIVPLARASTPPAEVCAGVEAAVRAHANGAAFTDDVTIACLRA